MARKKPPKSGTPTHSDSLRQNMNRSGGTHTSLQTPIGGRSGGVMRDDRNVCHPDKLIDHKFRVLQWSHDNPFRRQAIERLERLSPPPLGPSRDIAQHSISH